MMLEFAGTGANPTMHKLAKSKWKIPKRKLKILAAK